MDKETFGGIERHEKHEVHKPLTIKSIANTNISFDELGDLWTAGKIENEPQDVQSTTIEKNSDIDPNGQHSLYERLFSDIMFTFVTSTSSSKSSSPIQ